jgi:hypothetical protein
MKFFVKSYTYVPGSGPKLVQGVKGGRAPKNAVRGGNGSYLVVHEKAKAILNGSAEDGTPMVFDIAPTLRTIAYKNNSKLTQTRAITICDALVGSCIEVINGSVSEAVLEKAWSQYIN